MKTITAKQITEAVRDLCLKANLELRPDVLSGLKRAYARETDKRAAHILKAILENARVARKEKLAICQDTGLPCVVVELGQDLRVRGDLKLAIQEGVAQGYKKGSFRDSIVADPLMRGVSGYTPAMIHIDTARGNKLKLTVIPKGFGCENKTRLKMFNPTADWEEIKKFIIETVKISGPDACPPYVVGVGIGGSADYSCWLAKKALLKNIVRAQGHKSTRAQVGKRSVVGKLERELLEGINKLDIGPMGLGGKTTGLGVNMEIAPTHIAGLPVCVNISCHALRSAAKIL